MSLPTTIWERSGVVVYILNEKAALTGSFRRRVTGDAPIGRDPGEHNQVKCPKDDAKQPADISASRPGRWPDQADFVGAPADWSRRPIWPAETCRSDQRSAAQGFCGPGRAQAVVRSIGLFERARRVSGLDKCPERPCNNIRECSSPANRLKRTSAVSDRTLARSSAYAASNL